MTISGNTGVTIAPKTADNKPLLTQVFTGGSFKAKGFLLATATLAALGGSTSASVAFRQEQVREVRGFTATGGPSWFPGRMAAVSSQPDNGSDSLTDAVRQLHELSGLTWDQLGKLFGVSRRAVHHWASGGKMNAHNAALLAELSREFRTLPAADPQTRRSMILAPQEDGYSLFDRFRSRHVTGSGDVAGTPFTPAQLLGALHDD